MTISFLYFSKTNDILNPLTRNLEKISVFLLFFGFFETNLFTFQTTFNFISYILISFLFLLRWRRCIYAGTRDISLILLISLVLVSYFWSENPGDTLQASRSVLRQALFGIYLGGRYTPKELMKLITKLFALTLAIHCLFSVFAIGTGQSYLVISWVNDESSWTALSMHKQYLGRMVLHGGILFILSSIKYKSHRPLKYVFLGISTILLVLSKSKTSWIGFVLGLSLFPILNFVKFQYKLRTILYLSIVLIAGTILLVLFANLELIVVDILKKPPDFNGRFILWTMAIDSGFKKMWFGYGYAAFWRTYEGLSIINGTWFKFAETDTTSFHVHNGFIEMFLQMGLVGCSLFLFNLITVLKRVITLLHMTKEIEFFWMLEYIVIACLLQVTETPTLLSNSTQCSIYIAMSLSIIIFQNRYDNKTQSSNDYLSKKDERLLVNQKSEI
jgi:exopolysaccharide production protein ExoQ